MNASTDTDPTVAIYLDEAAELLHLLGQIEDWLIHCDNATFDDVTGFFDGTGQRPARGGRPDQPAGQPQPHTAAPTHGGRPVTRPTAPAIPDELDRLLRRMRLPYLRHTAPNMLATARAQRWDPAEVLRVLLAEEVTGRDTATRRIRRKTTAFPTGKTLAS